MPLNVSRVSLGRLSLVAGLLGAAAGIFVHGGVASAYGSCRSDPVLVVNGAVADVVSTLATDPSVIRELDYTVTVPAGSLIGRTTLTLGLGFPEKVTYVYSAAQPWGTLRVSATVQTQAGVAPFPTSVQVTTLLGGTQSASGFSNAAVNLIIKHQLML